jgi:hypothetical protein
MIIIITLGDGKMTNKFYILPKFTKEQTTEMINFLEKLNNKFEGNPIPVKMAIWLDQGNGPTLVSIRPGYWEFSYDLLYLAESNDFCEVGLSFRAAVILAIISQIESFGDQETIEKLQKKLNKVREYCYSVLVSASSPYSLVSNIQYIPVTGIGFHEFKTYFKTNGIWVDNKGEIFSGEPQFVIEVQDENS